MKTEMISWILLFALALAPLQARAQLAPGQARPTAPPDAALTSPRITGGTINGARIGSVVRSTGAFSAITGGTANLAGALANTSTRTLNVTGNVVGMTTGFAANIRSSIGQITGVASGAPTLWANYTEVQTDNADARLANASEIIGFTSSYQFGGDSFAGARGALQANLGMTADTRNPSRNTFHRALIVRAATRYKDGGTLARPNSNWFGIIDDTYLATGGLYWNSLVGQEIDVSIYAGASASYAVGLQIVQKTGHQTPATARSWAIGIANQLSARPTWNYGLAFGNVFGIWPFPATATLIGAMPTGLGGPAYTAANGVDWSAVTFTDSAFKSVGFSVSPAGEVVSAALRIASPTVPAKATDACAKGQVSYAANFVYVCVATNTWRRAALSGW